MSCATAAGVMRAIDRDKYDIVPIGVSRDGQWVLAADDPARFELTAGRTPEVLPDEAHVVLPLSTRETALTVLEAGQPPTELGNVDVVLPLLHGPFGEDGTLQGSRALRHPLRRLGGVRLGSGHGQALHEGRVRRAWSAHRALCRHHGPGVARRPRSRPRCAGLGYPLFVKPARAGSSMGISKVEDPADLEAAIESARAHDPKVVVEAAIEGREIECAVLEGHGLDGRAPRRWEEVAVHANHAFYDYEAKYLAEADVDLTCPADVPAHVSDEVRRPRSSGVRGVGLRGPGPSGLLLHGRRTGPRQRDQHDAGVHAALDVSADVGGFGPDLHRAHRRARSPSRSSVAPDCAEPRRRDGGTLLAVPPRLRQ